MRLICFLFGHNDRLTSHYYYDALDHVAHWQMDHLCRRCGRWRPVLVIKP
jgi:hypothetical protein